MKVQNKRGKFYQVINLSTYEVLLIRAETPLGALIEVVPFDGIREDNLQFFSGDWCVSKYGKGERIKA
jgi:hypothetical protein